ncbi:hypothetical protein BDW42DRAFT_33435 [Aspergillus taichungensis]|uniref:Uncharacterized protein n=1 Tax=Aspergillus taichungensis TaxID=482145 RepID=A0A2J5HFU7_9EURO|nr:hypothetical protein BDW42DRAFT_33435 [Aspergillus taichungensis]
MVVELATPFCHRLWDQARALLTWSLDSARSTYYNVTNSTFVSIQVHLDGRGHDMRKATMIIGPTHGARMVGSATIHAFQKPVPPRILDFPTLPRSTVVGKADSAHVSYVPGTRNQSPLLIIWAFPDRTTRIYSVQLVLQDSRSLGRSAKDSQGDSARLLGMTAPWQVHREAF